MKPENNKHLPFKAKFFIFSYTNLIFTSSTFAALPNTVYRKLKFSSETLIFLTETFDPIAAT